MFEKICIWTLIASPLIIFGVSQVFINIQTNRAQAAFERAIETSKNSTEAMASIAQGLKSMARSDIPVSEFTISIVGDNKVKILFREKILEEEEFTRYSEWSFILTEESARDLVKAMSIVGLRVKATIKQEVSE